MTPRALLGLALLLAGCIGVTTESRAPVDLSAPGRWITLAPLPTARQEVAAATLGGRVYVIGGLGASGEPVATVEAYDPATNRWETRAPLPAATRHTAAAVVGDRLFVLGGYTGGVGRSTAVATVYEYDLPRNSWATRAPLPTPRGALAVAALGGRIHALGGSGDRVSNAHEVYDPVADRWTGSSPLPVARDHHAAVAFRGRVWVLGGRESFIGAQYASVDIYDPPTAVWTTGPPLPSGRGGLAAAVVGDRIFVFGGEAPLRIFSANEMYEVAGNRWIAKEAMPAPRHGIGAAVIGSTVYIAGGATQPGLGRTDVHEAYIP